MKKGHKNFSRFNHIKQRLIQTENIFVTFVTGFVTRKLLVYITNSIKITKSQKFFTFLRIVN
jgi:hypothetical protein